MHAGISSSQFKPFSRVFQRYISRLNSPLQPCRQLVLSNSTVQGTVRHRHQTIHNVSKPDFNKDTSQAQELYELSLGLSRTPAAGNMEMLYTLYNANGAAAVLSKKLSKLKIASNYGLSMRDLRTIDLPSNGIPHILIREDTMLVHMLNLRLLVQADQVLIFHHEKEKAAIGGHEQDNTSRVFCNDLESKLCGDSGMGASANLPYELRVLEAALASVTSTLEAEYLLARKQVSSSLQVLDLQMLDKEESLIHSEIRTLLDLVRKLAGIEQRARHVRSAVQEVLNDDQDMADMYLSDKQAGKPHAVRDHQEVEYLLEAYYKASDAVVQESAGLMGNVQQTEETIRSILDVRRNQIMVLEAKIEIIMVGLGASTLVAGLYGMNVVNYLEESWWAFGMLVSFSVVGTALISRYGMRKLRNIQKMHL